jgi:hypothetical protein
MSGSTRLSIAEETKFTIFDNDGGFYESDFDVEVYFRNILV